MVGKNRGRLLSESSPVDMASLDEGLSRIEQAEELDRGIRTIIFDEDGATDLGRLGPEQLHEVVGDAVGEVTPVTTPPLSEEQIKEMLGSPQSLTLPAPAIFPEPVARMSNEKLEQRVRIVEQWRTQHPKRPGTIAHTNWLMYTDGMTVNAYLASHERRRARRDLQWDIDHGFIYLQSPEDYATEMSAVKSGEIEN